jgi:hypothetical protein
MKQKMEDKILNEMKCACIKCGCPTDLGAHDITGFCKACGDIAEAEERAEEEAG